MAIEINANLKLGSTLSNLARMVATLQKVKTLLMDVNDQLQNMAMNAGWAGSALAKAGVGRGSGSGSRNGGGGGSRAPARSPRPPRFDPFGMNPQAGMSYFARGAAAGNPFAAQMYGRYAGRHSSLMRNQSRAQMFLGAGGNGNPMSALLSNVVSSTRFGKGGGQVLGHHVMQLLQSQGGQGILSSLLGGGGGAGAAAGGGMAGLGGAAAIAGPFAAAAAVVGSLVAVVGMANSALKEWTASLISGGGTGAQASSANRIGGAIGSNLSGVGKGLSPYAAAQLGLNPVTGPFGAMDYNARGLKAAEAIRKSKSFESARRKAEMFGDPNLANAYLLSKDNWNLMRNPDMRGVNKGDEAVSANFGASMSNAWAGIQKLIQAFGTPILKAVSEALTDFAKYMQKVDPRGPRALGQFLANGIRGFSYVLGLVERVAGAIATVFTWLLDHLPKKIKEAMGIDEAGDMRRSMRDLKGAIDANTQSQREGLYGGGGRASGATPGKLTPAINNGWHNVRSGVL